MIRVCSDYSVDDRGQRHLRVFLLYEQGFLGLSERSDFAEHAFHTYDFSIAVVFIMTIIGNPDTDVVFVHHPCYEVVYNAVTCM